jgi:hypothetical protein
MSRRLTAPLSSARSVPALLSSSRLVQSPPQYRERPRADLIDAPDESQPENPGHEQRDADDQPADEQNLFQKRGRTFATPGALDQMEADETHHERHDDGNTGLEHGITRAQAIAQPPEDLSSRRRNI